MSVVACDVVRVYRTVRTSVQLNHHGERFAFRSFPQSLEGVGRSDPGREKKTAYKEAALTRAA